MGKSIDVVLHALGPFFGSATFVKGGVGNGFSYDKFQAFVVLGEHLGGEEGHFKAELDTEFFAQVGDVVEAVTIACFEEEGHYVALIFHGFLDEGGLPFKVVDGTVFLLA